MDAANAFSKISSADFNALLGEYPNVVSSKLAELDEERYVTIPAALAERKAAWKGSSSGKDAPSLKKHEVVKLVEWKLSHGTFRPSLKALAQSNSEEDVGICTVAGFVYFNPISDRTIPNSIKSLSGLKGIGPATASLLLSVYDPENAPFFSDELFRWSLYEPKPGKGWDRLIKYTPKEYMELFTKVKELRERLNVRAIDAEKVAYVLGRRAAGKSAESDEGSQSLPRSKATGKRKAEDVEADMPQTQKPARKATGALAKTMNKQTGKVKEEPTRGLRSSTRLKTAK